MRITVCWLLALVLTACGGLPLPKTIEQWRPPDRNALMLGAALGALDVCALLAPGATPRGDGCVVDDGKGRIAGARVADWPPERKWGAAPAEIAGKKAYRTEYPLGELLSGCTFAVPVSFRVAVEFEYKHQAFDKNVRDHCRRARGVAEAGVRALVAEHGFGDFLFAPDENDTGSLGACEHLRAPDPAACEPARLATLPDDPGQVLASGAADPHVACAVFAPAVGAVYGKDFAAVTYKRGCRFVRPDHRLQIEADLAVDGVCGDGRAEPAKATIRNKPVVTFQVGARHHHCVALHGDLHRAGAFGLVLAAHHQRGVQRLGEPELPAKDIERARAVVERVLDEHFR